MAKCERVARLESHSGRPMPGQWSSHSLGLHCSEPRRNESEQCLGRLGSLGRSVISRWAAAIALVVITGCHAGVFVSSSPTPLASAGDRPIDARIAPVSRSSPSKDAKAAMDVCSIDQLGLDAIAGMGLIDHASDASLYAPLTGREPELKSSVPAWMIQLQGWVPQLRGGEVWIDPICVVIDGYGGFYATGPVQFSDGTITSPMPAASPPSYRLPPLTK